jgi:hypothetical protein
VYSKEEMITLKVSKYLLNIDKTLEKLPNMKESK